MVSQRIRPIPTDQSIDDLVPHGGVGAVGRRAPDDSVADAAMLRGESDDVQPAHVRHRLVQRVEISSTPDRAERVEHSAILVVDHPSVDVVVER